MALRRVDSGQCYCDYTFHVMVEGALPSEIFDKLGDVRALRNLYAK